MTTTLTSTMVATRAALVTALEALVPTTLAGVKVTYGDPGGVGQREGIWLGPTVTGLQETRAHSTVPRKRVEDYEFDVIVEVVGKATPAKNELRAAAIGAEVEDLIATTPKLSEPAGLLWVQVGDFELDTTEVGGDGPRTVITYTIEAKGRLQ